MHDESVYLGFGSNVGDREAHIRAGIDALQGGGLRLQAASSLYLTEPDLRPADSEQGAATSSDDEHPWYVNCVAAFDQGPEPTALLAMCLDIERAEGRDRPSTTPGSDALPEPRTLDIDILLFGSRVIDEPGLQTPHPRMLQRRFVLEPLAEIAPDMVHPTAGRSISELLQALPVRERVSVLQQQPHEVA